MTMTSLQFESRQRARWDELEQALAAIETGRKAKKDKPAAKADAAKRAAAAAIDPARFATLYRAACEDLALARSRAYPVHLTARLEDLTARAHQLIYRQTDYGLARLKRLALIAFPQAVRAHWRYLLVAGLVFGLPLVLIGLATYADPGFVLSVHDADTVRQYDGMYGAGNEPIGRERGADSDWMMFGHYIMNNIGIAFQCFAGGVFVGLGSLFFLAYNGAAAGSVAGYVTARGHGEAFYSFVVTHGAFELTAIVIAGAAGLRLGHALLAPGRHTRLEALKIAASEAAVLVYGTVAMLVIAAALEAFWSSARWVAPSVKYGVGAACWMLVIGYLAAQGRPRGAAASTGSNRIGHAG
ncbi:MAG TPA: stage II sporulation protein M [Burkholderiaceae bacterium]